jgi:hypothetical protein
MSLSPQWRAECLAPDRGVEAPVMRGVVGDVWCVPSLLAPGQERLSAEFLQHSGVGEGGNELLVGEPSELRRADTVAAAELHDGAGAYHLSRGGDVVPAGGVRRPGVEQGVPEHGDLVLVRETGLLSTQ